MQFTNLYVFRDFAGKIHRKATSNDPNFFGICVMTGTIEYWVERVYPSLIPITKESETAPLKAKAILSVEPVTLTPMNTRYSGRTIISSSETRGISNDLPERGSFLGWCESKRLFLILCSPYFY
jgi:hypothetical protein